MKINQDQISSKKVAWQELFRSYQKLQKKHGARNLCPIPGCGDIWRPRVMFVFMNPTARNVSASPLWSGVRAPWLGTKNIWQLFQAIGLLSLELFQETQRLKNNEWTPQFAQQLYQHLTRQKVYITNLSKITQPDARSLPNSFFKQNLSLLMTEIDLIQPQKIVTFGGQVSSITLRRPIKIADEHAQQHQIIIKDKKYNLYPAYYPVGQGRRNLPLAIKDLVKIINIKITQRLQ
ncbi:MAG: hypothetical protein COX77_01505 [Candidatus Komeilibacteria bacterium CG_4_10_14_0_2_um_filter_37_10]|uniref:Uracil-DNA glycosylase-like domain-containing protein n=1 Tax=Candidatus Komeilibacteria bacterium CG_4_10_14_0_2_um_filter_37_10 TaxID=1974470 RepID=A0A2M7VFN0_9BACT|nr:MAG: hypothetical protein COX77_01505 [Candidatus Komeilibacteria bacterium CG_4_10_14_0_2_um_filter_37_10]PJA93605.1 MAG: hypothetical protein CO133_01115 [Candidatus Komeilibacteria bacterium CG_4_9_14_3_um_filter_37_5]